MKIALRNVMRNKRRSLLSLLIILSGVAILFLVNGYKSYVYSGMGLQAIIQYGDFQIAKPEFWQQNMDQNYLLADKEINSITEILKKDKNVKEFTSEISFSGVLGTEKRSTIISGTGVIPGSTRCQNLTIKEGTNLFENDKDQVLIGQGIIKKLNLKIGEWVNLMVTTGDGAYNAGSLQVAGSFSTGNTDADNYYIILPLSFAQGLLNTNGIDKIIVYLNDSNKYIHAISFIKKQLNREKVNIKIKSWLDLASLYKEVRGMFDLIFLFLSIVIFILVFLSIFEIMSMSFFERMKEIGTIRAIGTKWNQVLWLLIQEALILGCFGGILGILTGWGLGFFINQLGITYYPPTISQPIPLGIELSFSNCYFPLGIVIFSAVLSALNPAIKASRLNVVEMFRHE
jgi:putative ABC transport system permease protein